MKREDLEILAAALDTIHLALGAHPHLNAANNLRRDVMPIFDRFAFPIGAKVRLTKTPEISWSKSWGWMRAKHYLVEGAIATVETVDLWEGKFNYGLIFDGASYINEMTKEVVPLEGERRGIYIFGESWVERVPLAKAVAEPANIAAEVAS